MPSWPIRLRAGTRTSSRKIIAVSDARMPSLSSLVLRSIPLASIGTTIRLLLRCGRSEEHTSELQSLMRNSYAVFCLKKKTTHQKCTIDMMNNIADHKQQIEQE